MATLGNIRKHGVLLLVVVGVAMLAFIVGDFISSSNSYFSRKREYVGVVEGNKIHFTEYQAAKDQLTEVYKIEYGRSDFDEDATANIANQVWNMLVSDYTLTAQAEKIGMAVTTEELSDLCIGDNPHQLIRSRRAFYDQTGNFNRLYLIQFINSLSQEVEDPQQQEMIERYKQYWSYWEKAVRLTYLQEKYVGLLSGCVTANSVDAEFAFNAGKDSVNVEFVVKPFYTVADSLITVSDKDIKALYAKNKKQYKQEPNRAISYITYAIVPSEDDFKAAEESLQKVQEEFYTTDDVLTVVNLNSDITYDARNLSADQVPAEYKDFAFGAGAKTGNHTDLVFNAETNTYAMARLVEAGYSRPDSVQLKAANDTTGIEAQWFTEDDLLRGGSKELADKAFSAKKGDKISVSLGMTEQEFLIVNVSAATPKVKLAIMARTVTPSSRTIANLYNEAKRFVVENNNEEKFEAAAEEAGLMVHPATNLLATTEKVDQLKSSRAVVKWAFEAKEGAVSDVFECGDQLLIATLTDINEDEYRSIDDVKGELRFQALNEKKGEYLAKNLADASTLEAVAAAWGVDVLNAEVTFGSYSFASFGAEPAVIGAAAKLAEGATSAPVVGRQGVYVLRAGAHVASAAEYDKEAQISQLNMRSSYSLPYQALGLIQDNADIEDNRANFQ